MPGNIEKKLEELGIALPTPAAPIANYVGFVRTGRLLFVSGQLCRLADGTLVAKGKLGPQVTTEQGQASHSAEDGDVETRCRVRMLRAEHLFADR